MVLVGAVGAVATVIGVVVACIPSTPAPGSVNVPGDDNTVNVPSGNCVQVTGSCTVQILQDALNESSGNDTELKKRLRAAPGASQSPTGSGPWPFVVVDTADLGLFARTTNTVNGTRVGNTANHSLVWANCISESDFTPADVSGENNVGPEWVQVRWKPLASGIERGLSEPTETQTAWMYRGALEPVGHNGNIPSC
jgi:hypothetical protein